MTLNQDYFLGIDLGTSALKLLVMDSQLREIVAHSVPLSCDHPFSGASQQEASQWWDALVEGCAYLYRSNEKIWNNVTAIGLSGQMHGCVILDRTMNPIRPVILWNDGRATQECVNLWQRCENITDIAGCKPMAGFTAPKVMWLKTHEPQSYDRICHILLPKDYIGFRLHGNLVTDPSDAAGTLWLNQGHREWSDDVCHASDTQRSWLPTITHGHTAAGNLTLEAARALNLRQGIAIAAGGGDAATGAVGIGAIVSTRAFISIGTSAQVFVASSRYQPAANGHGALHSYAHTLPNLWFQMAAMLNGASPIYWFAKVCGANIDQLLDEASKADPTRAPLALPYLQGERTPHANSAIRAGFYDLDNATTRGEMMYGLIQAIAFTFADATLAINATETNINEPLAIGGGARSDLLLQLIANVMGTPIHRAKQGESGAAHGAAKLAALAVGATHLNALATLPTISQTFTPQPTQREQNQLTRYRDMYHAVSTLTKVSSL